MLVQFTAENFRSFKGETTFSMVASREKGKENRLVKTFDGDLLRTAVFYGANGSGKSNFIKAVETFRFLVLNSAEFKSEEKLNPDPFLLEKHENPTGFEIIIFINNTYYTIGITYDNNTILSEWVYKLTAENFTVLYEREGKNKIKEIAREQITGPENAPDGFLDALVFGLKPNQCLLSVLAKNEFPEFGELALWFNEVDILTPKGTVFGFEKKMLEDINFLNFFSNAISKADLGIQGFSIEKRLLEDEGWEVEGVPTELKHMLKSGDLLGYPVARGKKSKGLFSWDGNNFVLLSPKFKHGNAVFDIDQESDGTQRFYQLLAMIYQFWIEKNPPPVVLIDELDSSLHTGLCRNIVEACLAGKSGQLIFTTHDTNLLRKEIFRRDEIWFSEKRPDGSTKLYSLFEFLPTLSQRDATLEDDYLNGFFGQIPFGGDPKRFVDEFSKSVNDSL